ncbi:MAG: hypothetical protein ACLQCW_00550, partial [Methanoregula sp.]|uniref:hypothetical protein n=1 Tax=Methanoregula sp. TaxID=2052170 RepID=UPI003FD8BA36
AADAIGLYINDWSSNEIVLGGFGHALGTDNSGTWNIGVGDPIVVTVVTKWGQASYNLVVS